jgi:hypothetical protein
MNNRNFIFGMSVLFAIMMIGFSCSLKWLGKSSWQPPKVVAIEGAEGCIVYPLHFPLIFVPVQEGQPIHLSLRDGDLVFVYPNGPSFPYRNSDGRYLSVAGDEIQTMLNGKTVSLNLDKDEAWQWLEKATSEDLDALRAVHISNEIDEKQLALLKRLSERNSNLDMFIGENTNWRQVLPMFDPEWLTIEVDALGAKDLAMLAAKKQLRNLLIDGETDISFLSQMPGFETLWINEWDPEKTGPLPKDLKNLKRLYLQSMEAKDLTPLTEQPNLEELSLAGSAVDDLSRLANFPELRVLNLAGCGNLRDLAPLKQLQQLKWLSLPPTTTQQQLVEVVHDHPDLVGLELFGAKNITDLTPLKGLRHLEFLLVAIPNTKPDTLFEMKKLKWLATYTEEEDEKKEKAGPKGEDLVVMLQRALPATAVVRVDTPCLGSGWILLLLPGVGLAWLLEKRRNRNAFAAGTKDARV